MRSASVNRSIDPRPKKRSAPWPECNDHDGDGMWNPSTEKPEIGRRIVALGNGGTEAVMFFAESEGCYADDDGDVYELDLAEDFVVWAYLPDDYKMLFETDEEAELVGA